MAFFGTLAPHSKHGGGELHSIFNHLEAQNFDSLEKNQYVKQKPCQINVRIPCVWLRPKELRCSGLLIPIVSWSFLKSNSQGGCSGNLAEDCGNAGLLILGGKSMKKQWFLKSKGTGGCAWAENSVIQGLLTK